MKNVFDFSAYRKIWLFRISADGGETWTVQWLTDEEVTDMKNMGYIVQPHKIGDKI